MLALKIVKRMASDCRDAIVLSGSASINIESSAANQADISQIVPNTRCCTCAAQSTDQTAPDTTEVNDDPCVSYICNDGHRTCSSDEFDATVPSDAGCQNAECRLMIIRNHTNIEILHSKAIALENEMAVQKDDLDKANKVVNGIIEALLCPICLDTFDNPHVLRCGHTYCQECLIQWFGQSKVCPTCRTTVVIPPTPSITIRNIISCTIGEAPASLQSSSSSGLGTGGQSDPWQRLFPRRAIRPQNVANTPQAAPVRASNPPNPANPVNQTRRCASCSSPLRGATLVCDACGTVYRASNHSNMVEVVVTQRAVANNHRNDAVNRERQERVQPWLSGVRRRPIQRSIFANSSLIARSIEPEARIRSDVHASRISNPSNNVRPLNPPTPSMYSAHIDTSRRNRNISSLRPTTTAAIQRSLIPVATPVHGAASLPAQSFETASTSSTGNIRISRTLGQSRESPSLHEIDMLDRALDQMVHEQDGDDDLQETSTINSHINDFSSQRTSNSSGDATVPGLRSMSSRPLVAQVSPHYLATTDPDIRSLNSATSSTVTGGYINDDDLTFDMHMAELIRQVNDLNTSDSDH